MSDRRSNIDRESALRQAFAEAAKDLDLEFDRPASAAEEPRMVGALAPAAHVTTDVDDAAMPKGDDHEDSLAIQEVIEKWETADVDKLVDVASQVANDPYVIIKPVQGGSAAADGNAHDCTEYSASVVDHVYFRGWVQSETFLALTSKFEPKDPRDVQISGINISFVGPTIASVVYQTKETGTQGVYNANVGAFMVKHSDGGWKYIAMTRTANVS